MMTFTVDVAGWAILIVEILTVRAMLVFGYWWFVERPKRHLICERD